MFLFTRDTVGNGPLHLATQRQIVCKQVSALQLSFALHSPKRSWTVLRFKERPNSSKAQCLQLCTKRLIGLIPEVVAAADDAAAAYFSNDFGHLTLRGNYT